MLKGHNKEDIYIFHLAHVYCTIWRNSCRKVHTSMWQFCLLTYLEFICVGLVKIQYHRISDGASVSPFSNSIPTPCEWLVGWPAESSASYGLFIVYSGCSVESARVYCTISKLFMINRRANDEGHWGISAAFQLSGLLLTGTPSGLQTYRRQHAL